MILFYAFALAFIAKSIFKSWVNPILLSYVMVSFQLVLGQLIRSLAYPLDFCTGLDLIYLVSGCCLIFGYLLWGLIYGRLVGSNWGLERSTSRTGLILANRVLLVLGSLTLLLLVRADVLTLSGIRRFYIDSRQDGGFGALIFLIGLLGPIMFVSNLSVKNKAWAIIILFIMLLTGKKAPLFTSMLLFVVYMFDSNRVVTKKTVFLVLSGFVGIVILQVSTSTSSLSGLKIVSGYFAYYNYASIVVKTSYLYHDLYDLFEINISRLWKLIPRLFYSDKPVLYGYNLVHAIVFPNEYSLGFTPGISSKITVPFFESGYIGVVVYGIINGMYTGCVAAYAAANRNVITKIVCIKLVITGFSLYTAVIVAVIIIISKINVKKAFN